MPAQSLLRAQCYGAQYWQYACTTGTGFCESAVKHFLICGMSVTLLLRQHQSAMGLSARRTHQHEAFQGREGGEGVKLGRQRERKIWPRRGPETAAKMSLYPVLPSLARIS